MRGLASYRTRAADPLCLKVVDSGWNWVSVKTSIIYHTFDNKWNRYLPEAQVFLKKSFTNNTSFDDWGSIFSMWMIKVVNFERQCLKWPKKWKIHWGNLHILQEYTRFHPYSKFHLSSLVVLVTVLMPEPNIDIQFIIVPLNWGNYEYSTSYIIPRM